MSDQPPSEADETLDGEDLTAGEYALGVLTRTERAAAEARSANEPEFAAQIVAWVVRFEALTEEVAAVEPSASLWPRIEVAIERPATTSRTRHAPAAPLIPANDIAPRRLAMWRTWAIGASAVAAAAVLVVVLRTPGLIGGGGHGPLQIAALGHSDQTLVATLSLTETKASAMTVAYDPSQSTLYAAPDADFSIPISKAAELWLIPSDGKPRPMGLVDPSKPATMPMPPQFKKLAQEKATLAISIEPSGGSPTGAPTGPVVATGKLIAV